MLASMKWEDAVGKTVKAVAHTYCHRLLIAFTDGTFIAIEADEGGWDDEPILEDIFRLDREGYDDAFKCGLVTQEEFDAKRAEWAKGDESYERAQYERLKAQFEPRGT